MNERIEELAIQAGLESVSDDLFYAYNENLELFAELVAAAERESCAKVADEMSEDVMRFECWQTHALELCGEAIRARGDKHE